MFGCVMKLHLSASSLAGQTNATYKRSPVFKSLITAMPSIMLAAELPKNLLRGFSVPSTRI
jgi:hypothetical protein